MSRSLTIAPVTSRLGPYLAKKRWFPLTIWLVRFKRKLGLRNDYDLIEHLLILGASATYAPMVTLKQLSEQSDVPESTLYGWITSLQRKGYLRVIRTKNTAGRYGPSRYDLGPLFARIEELHRALTDDAEPAEPVDNSVSAPESDSGSPDNPSGPGSESIAESGQPVRHAPDTVYRLPGESENSDRELPPKLEKQFRGLAARYGPRFQLKPGAQLTCWRDLFDYAGAHHLSRPLIETLLDSAASDRRFQNPDGLWRGLDYYRASLRKESAA